MSPLLLSCLENAIVAKLTKNEAKAHQEACALIEEDRPLTEEEKEFVLSNWQESSDTSHGLRGAFFTPLGLARDMALEVWGDVILDIGAGIGTLAYGCRDLWGRRWNNEAERQLICVESSPEYIQVGKRILPEAQWICGDIFDVKDQLIGVADTVIGNPPFGSSKRTRRGPRFRGPQAEYHWIDVASDLGRRGVFIIPQNSAPFRYSGQPCYEPYETDTYTRFSRQTGLVLEANVGIDTSYYRDDWHGVSPTVEIVTCDFTERAAPATQMPRAKAA
jgi:hypothetical protein